jgi:hypothetical protein
VFTTWKVLRRRPKVPRAAYREARSIMKDESLIPMSGPTDAMVRLGVLAATRTPIPWCSCLWSRYSPGSLSIKGRAIKVFISWSGKQSQRVAEALRSWLPDVINAVEPFVSEIDIEKGSVGADVIAEQLHKSTFGIVCLTRDNQTRPWINYEAGALSKSVGDDRSKVATLLIDLDGPREVTGPLTAFQATRLRDKEDMKKLVRSIAIATKDARTPEKLNDVVERMWSALVELLEEPPGDPDVAPESEPPVRSSEDMFVRRAAHLDAAGVAGLGDSVSADRCGEVQPDVSSVWWTPLG